MKKMRLLQIICTMVLIFACTAVAYAADPFEGDNEVNIVYLGGSITQGAKASDPATTSWVAKMESYFKETYENDTRAVNNYNMGIGGTGSNLGISRLQRDVLSKNPDLVFVEFAVNDKWLKSDQILRNMESIVLTLQQAPTNPYIVFVYTTEQALATDSTYHQQVAEYYGIKSIDLQSIIKNDSSVAIADLLADGTHPNDTGYEYYFQKIKENMSNASDFTRPALKNEALSPLSYELYGVLENVSDNAEVVSGSWASNHKIDLGLEGDETGSIKFDFSGRTFGLMHYLGRSGGKYTIEIDGELIKTVDSYNAGVASQLTTGYIYFELEPGRHTAVITKLADANPNSEGNIVRLGYVITEDDSKAVQSVIFLDKNGNKISAAQTDKLNMAYAMLNNLTSNEIAVKGIAAVYNSDGSLSKVNTINKNVDPYSLDNFGLGLTLDAGQSMKLFIWDGLGSMKPYGTGYAID